MLVNAAHSNVSLSLQDKAVGPHPKANLEVLFTRERYAYMMNYLAFALPTTFSALVHQLTADQVDLWMLPSRLQQLIQPIALWQASRAVHAMWDFEATTALNLSVAPLQVGDHTTRAIWLGRLEQIKPELLHQMDKDAAAKGMSEEEIIWAVHAH